MLPRTLIAVSLTLVSLRAYAVDSNIDTVRTGNTIVQLKDRDYSVPRLSPSGHRVAFAHNPRDLSEVPEVLILDLLTSVTDTLLNRRSATTNGIFGVAVIEIEWLDEATIEVALTDGDVDITYATIFVDEPRVLDSHEVPGPTFEFPPERKEALEILTELHSDWDPKVIEHCLRNLPVLVPHAGAIVQANYVGHSNDVWWLSLRDSTSSVLVELPDDRSSIAALGAGTSCKGVPLFVVRRHDKAEIYSSRGETARLELVIDPADPNARIIERRNVHEAVWFLLLAFPTYQPARNVAMSFDGVTVRCFADFIDLSDFDVDARGRRVVFTHWQNVDRHLTVKELQ